MRPPEIPTTPRQTESEKQSPPQNLPPEQTPQAAPTRADAPIESAPNAGTNAVANESAVLSNESEITFGATPVAPTETFSRAAFLRDSDFANADTTATTRTLENAWSETKNDAASTRTPRDEAAPVRTSRAAHAAFDEEESARRIPTDAPISARHNLSSPTNARQDAPSPPGTMSPDAPPPSDTPSRQNAPLPPDAVFTAPASAASDAPRVLAQSHFAQMLGTFFWPCLVVMLLAYAWHPLAGGDDVWAHSSIGSWIWQRQEIPRESLFLWGAPPIPWVWHSWLSQLSFYAVMRFGALFQNGGGPYAIATFTVAIVALCFGLLWKNWRRHAPTGSVCALMFFTAIFAGVLRYRPRPELFTALFLVLLMLWLDAWWHDPSSREDASRETHGASEIAVASTRTIALRVLLLAAMFALWSNFHGAVLLGLVLLFATAFCDLWQSRADEKSRVLLGIALLCAAATLCNPFGIGVLMDSLVSARSGMFARIDEWKPPLPEPQLAPMIWCEITLIVMATIGWWRNPQRRLAHAVWLLLFFAMFLMQRRHLWILALVCLAVGAGNARFLDLGAAWKLCLRMLKQPPNAPSPMMRLAWRATLVFGLACAAGAALQDQRGNLFPLRGVNSIPAGAAAFVNAQKLRGRVFNDYENSSYFQWAWNGKNPLRPEENTGSLPSQARRALYIDLLNAYPPALLEEYLAIWKGDAASQKLLDQRDVKIIILGDDKRDRDFTKWLNANPQWRRVYDRRGDGLVWIRAAKNSAASREYSQNAAASRKPKMAARKTVSARPSESSRNEIANR